MLVPGVVVVGHRDETAAGDRARQAHHPPTINMPSHLVLIESTEAAAEAECGKNKKTSQGPQHRSE